MDDYRVPPQDLEIEKTVLGAIMLNREAYETASTLINEETFYNPANATIFKAFSNLYQRNSPIDLLTVKAELERMKELDLSGGVMYLAKLTSNVSSAANVEYHSMILQQKYIQRRLIIAGSEILKMAYDGTTDISDILDTSERLVSEAASKAILSANLKTLGTHLSESIISAQEREIRAKNGIYSGVPSGLTELDRMTGGFKAGELIILAARPSMGKSAMMLHIAKSAAKKGKAVCMFSLEMSGTSLADRIIVGESDINADNFRNGLISKDEWGSIDAHLPELAKLPIMVDDNSGVSMRYIYNAAKKAKKNGNCDIVMIDYLGLADMSDTEKNRNREQEVSKAVREAKNMAKRLQIPVILLSQLNRENEKTASKEPMLSMLRESGSLEQDADIVLFIHRPEYYGLEETAEGQSWKGVGKLIVAKQRNGPVGYIRFRYNESLTRISNYEERVDNFDNFYEPQEPQDILQPNTDFLPF